MNVRIALAITGVVALGAATTAGARTTSVNPCTLLSTKQVAAVHVDTGCKVLSNIVLLQVAPPGAKPISVVKPSKAMAKTIAAKLS